MKMNLVVSMLVMAQFDLKNAIVRFVDGATGTGKPNKLDIGIGEGNLTFDETKMREYTLDRGKLSAVRNGNETPMDVSLDFIWTFLKANTTTAAITPVDALKKRIGAATWVSSDSDLCNPYALDIQIWYDPQCATDKIEDIVLPDFRYEKLAFDTKAGMIKCSGKCNATEASVSRAAQT